MPLDQPGTRTATRVLRVAWLTAAFGACVYAFYDARALNGGFALPRKGVSSVPQTELVFYVWYALYGTLATAFLSLALTELGLGARLGRVWQRLRERPDSVVFSLSLLSFACSLAFRRLVLLDQPITDDEVTYVFIARTLLAGRVSNPVPDDPAFFANQFIVLGAQGWHGKYPVGHPLVLALGEALGLIELVVPALGAISTWLTYRVGRRLFGDDVALLGTILLLASPHFVWTHATLLSQPTTCTSMLVGMAALLRASDDGRARWLAIAGAAFGFGALARPLPGVLFALAGVVYCAGDALRARRSAPAILGRVALFGASAVPFGLTILAVNYAQSGDPLTTGYHTFHASSQLISPSNTKGEITNSVGGALIRENFWLLGWSFALALVPFCRPARGALLFWGMLAAELAYRVLAAKTVVAVTGPVYLTEVVPLLVLAVADAARRFGRQFTSLALRPETIALAASLTALCLFVPLQVGALLTGAETRRIVYDELDKTGAERALVFADQLSTLDQAVTWAYFPDNPSPDLDDPYLFVRVPTGGDTRARMLAFWRERFPDRRAFLFLVARGGDYQFAELR